MRRLAIVVCLLVASCVPVAAGVPDASTMDVYVTPYYNSSGPVVNVGRYSAGLASKDDGEFIGTIRTMKRNWGALGFPQIYVAAILLYDRGYRDEAVYWFYSAQYRGRLFAALADPSKKGGMGAPAFELSAAQDAFFKLTGPYVNGYAFGHIDSLEAIVARVRRENASPGDLRAVYPGVTFVPESDWSAENRQLNAGLGQLAAMLREKKDDIARERRENGTAAQFSPLTSKPFPPE